MIPVWQGADAPPRRNKTQRENDALRALIIEAAHTIRNLTGVTVTFTELDDARTLLDRLDRI